MDSMNKKIALVTVALTAALTGCGGGGGGSSSNTAPSNGNNTTPTTPVPPVVDPNALQTTVPNPSYQASSLSLDAYNTLNDARTQYGVGLLAENAALNTSSTNHAKYVTGQFDAGDYFAAGHSEDPTKAGFTGVTPADRASFAKYTGSSVGEALASFIQVDGVQSAPGKVAIENLLSAPYHRFGLLSAGRDVGVGVSSTRIQGEGGLHHIFVATTGIPQGAQGQQPSANWIGVWPVDNASNVFYGFAGETPNPIPVNNGACAGYPVSMQVKSGNTLATTTFTLTEAVSGTAVSSQLNTAATDPNPSYARQNTAYIIPFKPLKLNTKYTARFVGTNNGVAFEKVWSFTTMAQNAKLVYGCDPS
jgi:uncharacterized protein YkwD